MRLPAVYSQIFLPREKSSARAGEQQKGGSCLRCESSLPANSFRWRTPPRLHTLNFATDGRLRPSLVNGRIAKGGGRASPGVSADFFRPTGNKVHAPGFLHPEDVAPWG